jgi:hypothetical protein
MSMKKIGSITAHKLYGLITPEPMYEPIPSISKISDADGVSVWHLVYEEYTVKLTITKTEDGATYEREVIENVV